MPRRTRPSTSAASTPRTSWPFSTSLAFGTRIDAEAIHVEGIEAISLTDIAAADELGYRIKLLGVAERTARGVEQRVHPTMVAKSSAIAQVMGVPTR